MHDYVLVVLFCIRQSMNYFKWIINYAFFNVHPRYRPPTSHVQAWYDEVKDYSFPYPQECNPHCPFRCSGPVCTHYTQVDIMTRTYLISISCGQLGADPLMDLTDLKTILKFLRRQWRNFNTNVICALILVVNTSAAAFLNSLEFNQSFWRTPDRRALKG